MAIVRWNDPLGEFARLQNRINRAFGDAYGHNDEGLTSSGSWMPPVDIYQNGEHEIVLKADVPDMTREDIDITVDNGTLTIKGEKKALDRRERRALSPHREELRLVQPILFPASDRRHDQSRRRIPKRRADGSPPAS